MVALKRNVHRLENAVILSNVICQTCRNAVITEKGHGEGRRSYSALAQLEH
jgi:hypothetical protein